MNKFFLSIDSFLEKAEQRWGKITISIITGFFLLFLSTLVTKVNFITSYHGNGFTRLSLHPFDLENENDLRFRILSPLLGYLLFFRGTAFKYFMLVILALFFGVVYFFQRRDKLIPSEALGITALLAFSTLSFYQLYFPAYVDPLSFLLIFLFSVYYKNIFYRILLLLLMLFNHEMTLFLFPFFFLISLEANYRMNNIIKVLLQFVAAIIPYMIYRQIISSYSEIEFNSAYYFDAHNMKWSREHVIPHLLPGIFQAFRLTWILPIAAITVNIIEKRYKELLIICAIILFVFSQLIFAWDISRLVGLAFPAIIISARRMQAYLGTRNFLLLTYSIFLINFIIPSYYIGPLDPIPLRPFWWN